MPFIALVEIEFVGSVIVPANTVKPLLNVGVALTVNVFVDVVPNVVFPVTFNVVFVSVPDVVSFPVIVIFVNVCVPVQVLALANETLFKPLIALVEIELAGSVIVPVTVKPPFNVCNPVNVFVVFVA